jgi:LCP family protein required for cell wall assembly
VRRALSLALTLVITLLIVPSPGTPEPGAVLVRVNTAKAISHSEDVVWILLLGSDARPGQSVTRSRADAIHLVGINLKTGAASALGIPRDSWVEIPGYGSNKINAAMYFGGPQLMADAVGGLVGIDADFVFVTSFWGFRSLIKTMGGVTVRSAYDFSDPVLPGDFKVGKNTLDPTEALTFGRSRKYLASGDFARSANQNALLLGMLQQIRSREDEVGFMERMIFSGVTNLFTDLSPSEMYRLGQAATLIDPRKVTACVLQGGIGNIGGASVVLPNRAAAQDFGRSARNDATLDNGC